MELRVYHFAFGDDGAHVASAVIQDRYPAMEALETVYQLTNTIAEPWWESKDRRLIFNDGPRRSTSAGDVIAIYADANPTYYRVEGVGFELLEDDSEFEWYQIKDGKRVWRKAAWRVFRNRFITDRDIG